MDKTVNARKPDHAVELAGDPTCSNPIGNGHAQAYLAGQELVNYIRMTGRNPNQMRRMRLLVSPYLRTRQTAAGLRRALDEAGFAYDSREAMELREISFGLYDGLEDHQLAEMFPREHAHYQKHVDFSGELFAPMPMGESRIQVGDRVKALFGTILRDSTPRTAPANPYPVQHTGKDPYAGPDGPILDFVLVSHGVTIRQFRHRWLHWEWEQVEREPNPANCSIQLIEGLPGHYADELVFEGFRHVRGHEKQEMREDGHVLPDAVTSNLSAA
jgi:broad specificity phosphatase PhoE